MTKLLKKELRLIGRAEKVDFPELGLEGVPARIDTGARSSAVWASEFQEEDGVLSFVFFSSSSPHYTGERYRSQEFRKSVVASSNGQAQERYAVRLLLKLKGKKIRSLFTLADRSSQVYPVLIGRRALYGKFLVDVRAGRPLRKKERRRSKALQSLLNNDTVKK
jgi:hypothetical protein